MKYFPPVPNLFINGDGYLKGFLGLTWLPSDSAKAKVADYEGTVSSLLFGLQKRYTSYWILREIAAASPKRVEVTPPDFAPAEFGENASGGDLDAKTGTRDGSYIDASKRGTPGKTCLPEKKSDDVPATGRGADNVVAFRAGRWGGLEGPGSAADEILLHELVHAARFARGLANPCLPSPRDWGNYEEFLAVTLCNVFSSETGRGQRLGHAGFRKLPPAEATSAGFLAKYNEYLTTFPSDHPHLSAALKRAPGIPFNPFALM